MIDLELTWCNHDHKQEQAMWFFFIGQDTHAQHFRVDAGIFIVIRLQEGL